MNRKGFTLIELLAVLIIIAILGVLIVPGLLNNVDTAREKSYDTLIKNIVTSAQTYYEECEYGDLSHNTYEEYACEIIKESETEEKRTSYISATLVDLVNTGFLNVKDTKTILVDDKEEEIKIVKDPKTDNEISSCKIKITKAVDLTTYKVTYEITNNDTNDICPSIYE